MAQAGEGKDELFPLYDEFTDGTIEQAWADYGPGAINFLIRPVKFEEIILIVSK